MSLLDDVSIVVTPNGYKAGELYAVVPVPTEGAEEVTNGDFATDSDWVKGAGWTISGGNANSDGSGTAFLYQIISNVQTKRFLIEYEVKNYVSGSVSIVLGSAGSDQLTSSSNGVTSGIVVWDGTSDRLNFKSTSLNGSIDNVSVKEYTAADMDVTRATAATRVDENGLVNYAEIVGSEEVTNGDFATDSDWTKNAGWTISGGEAIHTGGGDYIRQSSGLVLGNDYRVIIEVSQADGGNFPQLYMGGITTAMTTVGTHTFIITAVADDVTTGIDIRGLNNCRISNVSVQQIQRDNVPRIDYTGGGCPHILAEPQRTNLITYSEDFSDSGWGNSSVGTTPVLTSGFTSPDGTDNAYKISNDNQDSMWFSSTLIGASDSRTIYARTVSGTGTAQLLSHNSNTNNTFNLTEEWQRFEVSTTTSGIGATSYYAVDFRGSGTLDEILIWGGQSEVGTYPTSYIPTSGSTVTRNQDQFSRDGISSLINSTEGVLFVEMAALSDDLTGRYISVSNGSSSDIIWIYFDSNSDTISIRTRIGGSTVAIHSQLVSDINDFNKVAMKWAASDYSFWVNGTEVYTSSNSSIWSDNTFNRIAFDSGGGSNTFFGKVKQLQVYKTALSDEQLIQLTGTSGTDFYESYAEMASALTYTIQ